MKICVFCSSSDAVAGPFLDEATALGSLLGRSGYQLVYGGGGFGLMGAVAKSARAGGARVTGVIPRFIAERTSSHVDELIVTEDLRARKARMEQLSDAFIALPGGFGTLEEVLEIVTLAQLGKLAKPVAFVNTRGFYDPLVAVFENLYALKFAKPEFRELYGVLPDSAAALAYIDSWRPPRPIQKWF